MRTLLLDADIPVFKSAVVVEDDLADFGFDDIPVDIDEAINILEDYIEDLKNWTNVNNVVCCLTDTKNFRNEILPAYKENRKGIPRPKAIPALRMHLITNYETYITPGLEADDVVGILGTHPHLIKGEKVIVSGDKDLRQIPGTHFDEKLGYELTITQEEGDYQHFMQTLTGDTSDNYKGAPGIGPKKAAKILEDTDKPWEAIVETYKAKGLTEEDALVQARVAKILQYKDFDFKTRKPKLWLSK